MDQQIWALASDQLGYFSGIPGVTHYDIVSHDLIVEICMLHKCI